MDGYNVEIPNHKAATYKVVTFIISLINLLAIAYALISAGAGARLIPGIGVALGIAAVFAAAYAWRGRGKTLRIPTWAILLACSALWIYLGSYFMGVSLLVFAILCFLTARLLVIRFSQQAILYPSTPAKRFDWSEIDFVMLKDDILSIELKNNQLLQFTLEPKVSAGIDTVAFNAFCGQAASRTA